mmetsp:Transcript_11401/g.30744  ORF Transcript_11401/g.30744 Transcript_11401/m.30744 type:complete len:280 (+) Transcript_11401:790-1629(+)
MVGKCSAQRACQNSSKQASNRLMASCQLMHTAASLHNSIGPAVAKVRGRSSGGSKAQSAAMREPPTFFDKVLPMCMGCVLAPPGWHTCVAEEGPENILNTGAMACGLPRPFTRTSKATKSPRDIHPPSKACETNASFPNDCRTLGDSMKPQSPDGETCCSLPMYGGNVTSPSADVLDALPVTSLQIGAAAQTLPSASSRTRNASQSVALAPQAPSKCWWSRTSRAPRTAVALQATIPSRVPARRAPRQPTTKSSTHGSSSICKGGCSAAAVLAQVAADG